MAHGSSRGVISALNQGIGSSCSVMMPCPWVPGFLHSQSPEKTCIGIEVTLTSEFDFYRWGPLAGKAAVPSLTDSEGSFWKTTAQVAAKATADDIEKEIRAQIERAEGFDFKPSHLDTHLGAIYAKPEFFDRYLKVAMEKGIPPVIAAGHLTFLSVEKTNVAAMMKAKAKEVWNAGFPVVDDIVTSVETWDVGQKKAKLEALLFGLRPGITHIIFRPVVPTDELRLILTSLGPRIQDNMILTDFGIKRVIENRKIVVTDWRDLKERRKKAKPIEN